jgi:hypothetical protein
LGGGARVVAIPRFATVVSNGEAEGPTHLADEGGCFDERSSELGTLSSARVPQSKNIDTVENGAHAVIEMVPDRFKKDSPYPG